MVMQLWVTTATNHFIFYYATASHVIFWVVDICDMNVVGEKCVWLQNKERIDTHSKDVVENFYK